MSTWDDKPNDYEDALKWIEQLQREVTALLRMVDYWKQKALKGENATELH